MATLTINHEGLARLRKDAKAPTNEALARRLGVDGATVSRVLSGRAAPGPRFIAGALRAFGTLAFSDVFLITEEQR
jgi:transcriptional regulator with XRE-family HTH domain